MLGPMAESLETGFKDIVRDDADWSSLSSSLR